MKDQRISVQDNFEWNRILVGHVLDKIQEIPDNSIDCIVTSPPYWGLRDYKTLPQIWGGTVNCSHETSEERSKIINLRSGNPEFQRKWRKKASTKNTHTTGFCFKCKGWLGSLGLEPTFKLYIKHLVKIFELLRPKLGNHGSVWVNLGDTYYGGGNAQGHTGLSTNLGASTLRRDGVQKPVARGKKNNIKRKSLVGIPDRFKIAMIDKGWICRNEITWYKKATMPSSAKDRFTIDFEKFYFFTKNSVYNFKQQFDEYTAPLNRYGGDNYQGSQKYQSGNGHLNKNINHTLHSGDASLRPDLRGRNKRTVWSIEGINEIYHNFILERLNEFENWISSLDFNLPAVWQINPAAFAESHFAVFPEKLIEVPIDSTCPRKVCLECGQPEYFKYVKNVIKDREPRKSIEKITTCDCNLSFRKGRVLDPFMGSGTTAIVAYKQNKDWLGIELSEKYAKMADKRIKNNTSILLDNFFEDELIPEAN